MESLWVKGPGSLSVQDVYNMAVCLGSELQTLTEQYGPDAVSGVVPQVVRVLELLESYAGGSGRERSCTEEELLIRAVHRLQFSSREEPAPAEQLLEAQKKEHVLQNQLSQLTEENQKLLGQLAERKSKEDCAVREERDLMLQLKKVVDMQRDQIRALTHETTQKNKDTEALQEQLDRFMKMNEDLRHKMSVLQAQLKSSLQRKTELETLLQERQKENDTVSKSSVVAPGITDSNMNTTLCATLPASKEDSVSSQPCFTKEEVKQILQERNELKTNLFLVNEELQYFQRELLNDERMPSLLLRGIKSAIRKQRKKIKVKMLGITESATSSDDEDNTWMQTAGTDCVDSKPPDSKIKSLFGTWYSKQTDDTAPWEIISPKEINQEQKGETSNEND
ncbi:Rab interacting lysosomal protein S homeolog [Xenopus laevis]|uniref:RILP-like protein 2 n=1 Tax=Xenopus laevis TaxID=8355 RepID=Q0IHB6_XENLA|nr:Rab interacting lysosomal protein S homeolog [Xenopus laevis]AAI23227.1 MGC154468 protein [Xenopus laevis]